MGKKSKDGTEGGKSCKSDDIRCFLFKCALSVDAIREDLKGSHFRFLAHAQRDIHGGKDRG